MNENDARRLAELLENLAITEAIELLLKQAEAGQSEEPSHLAMIVFLRSLHAKYRRKTAGTKIRRNGLNDIEVVDETLRRFFDN